MSQSVEIKVGTPVMATAGREKGSLFVAVGVCGGFVYLADGKRRKTEKPKRKSMKHISPVGEPFEGELTNKRIRRLIYQSMTRTGNADRNL